MVLLKSLLQAAGSMFVPLVDAGRLLAYGPEMPHTASDFAVDLLRVTS